jgi:hypothetical protein
MSAQTAFALGGIAVLAVQGLCIVVLVVREVRRRKGVGR